MKPEMERYEWVVIRHPELASSNKPQVEEDSVPSEGQNSDSNNLQQPDKNAGDLSPFLATRHFNLNSKNTSMFMAGNFDSIIVGKSEPLFCFMYIMGRCDIYKTAWYGHKIQLFFFWWLYAYQLLCGYNKWIHMIQNALSLLKLYIIYVCRTTFSTIHYQRNWKKKRNKEHLQ